MLSQNLVSSMLAYCKAENLCNLHSKCVRCQCNKQQIFLRPLLRYSNEDEQAPGQPLMRWLTVDLAESIKHHFQRTEATDESKRNHPSELPRVRSK